MEFLFPLKRGGAIDDGLARFPYNATVNGLDWLCTLLGSLVFKDQEEL